jgi:large subunit ribosomal protein L18
LYEGEEGTMDKLKAKTQGLKRRQTRVRGKIRGTAERPRLRVTRSNANIYAQVIDDVAGKTLVSASSLDAEFKSKGDLTGATVGGAAYVGELVGKRAADARITTVVFDRGGHLYHGRVKALADGARKTGLEF